MLLRDNVDLSTFMRQHDDSLPHGVKRNAELDRALACEALAHSRNLFGNQT